ncbi:hypothetical protein RUM44_011568 [Polyplax serrata]|uniref:Uncharacterized protein n=1 Tax=Polyplax serrata TaxID=468196 RepID=A0ABR1ARX0_POLSC
MSAADLSVAFLTADRSTESIKREVAAERLLQPIRSFNNFTAEVPGYSETPTHVGDKSRDIFCVKQSRVLPVTYGYGEKFTESCHQTDYQKFGRKLARQRDDERENEGILDVGLLRAKLKKNKNDEIETGVILKMPHQLYC